MAVLAGKTKNLNKQACLEDVTAVGEVLSRIDTSLSDVCGNLSAVGGGLLTPENKSTIRATGKHITNIVKSQVLLSFITGERRCRSVAVGYFCVETKGHKVHHTSRFGKFHDAKINVKLVTVPKLRKRVANFPSPSGGGFCVGWSEQSERNAEVTRSEVNGSLC